MTSPFSCRTVMKRRSRSGSVSVLSVRLKNSGSDDVLRERQACKINLETVKMSKTSCARMSSCGFLQLICGTISVSKLSSRSRPSCKSASHFTPPQ